MTTQSLRTIAANAIRSTKSNTSIAAGEVMSADNNNVQISEISFNLDEKTKHEVETRASKILDILKQNSTANEVETRASKILDILEQNSAEPDSDN